MREIQSLKSLTRVCDEVELDITALLLQFCEPNKRCLKLIAVEICLAVSHSFDHKADKLFAHNTTAVEFINAWVSIEAFHHVRETMRKWSLMMDHNRETIIKYN